MNREKANDPSPQSSCGGAVTILVKPVILRRLGTQLRRFLHTFTRVSGWKHCSSSQPTGDLSQSRLLFKSPFFHPAFLIEDQSLQEGCVISRSFDRLGIAPNVRRSVVKVLAPRPPCLHGLEGTGRTVGFWDIHPTNRDRFVPGSFQIGNSLLNKLHSCPINGFPIYPRCHIALLGCDTLVRQQPQFDVVQLLKQLVELDFWLECHLAQCCKDGVWMLHCVLLSSSYH